MPTVQAKQTQLTAVGVLGTAEQVKPTITKTDVEQAILTMQAYVEANAKLQDIEKAKDQALLVVMEKALGINSLDQLKQLNENEVATLLQTRMNSKAFALADQTDFNIKQYHKTTAISWKAAFIAKLGEAASIAAQNEFGRQSYSYMIVPAI